MIVIYYNVLDVLESELNFIIFDKNITDNVIISYNHSIYNIYYVFWALIKRIDFQYRFEFNVKQSFILI
jgi:hypothetical protein